MRRRRRKQDNGLGLLLVGVILCAFVVYQFATQNLPLFFLLIVVVGAIAALVLIVQPRRTRRQLFEKANVIIDQHEQQLAKRRAQLVRQDAYGKPLLDKWYLEVNYFITEHIRPSLTSTEQAMLDKTRMEIARMIISRTESIAQHTPIFTSFSETMTPVEFEAFCAEQLRACGWDAHLTPTTGDQGVDVVAEKNGLRIVLQCKLYSGSVGNAAIQEIVAGKAWEKADCCAVVTNSRYTPAAEQLASANGVLLLHYTDLPDLDVRLLHKSAAASVPFPSQVASMSISARQGVAQENTASVAANGEATRVGLNLTSNVPDSQTERFGEHRVGSAQDEAPMAVSASSTWRAATIGTTALVVLALVLLGIKYFATRPRIAPIQDKQSIDSVEEAATARTLNTWIASFRSKDTAVHVDCYAPVVETYFRKHNVINAQIRSDKERAFADIAEVRRYEITDVQIERAQDDRIAATFRKDWDTVSFSGKQFAGSEIEKLTFAKYAEGWRIVREEELKILRVTRTTIPKPSE